MSDTQRTHAVTVASVVVLLGVGVLAVLLWPSCGPRPVLETPAVTAEDGTTTDVVERDAADASALAEDVTREGDEHAQRAGPAEQDVVDEKAPAPRERRDHRFKKTVVGQQLTREVLDVICPVLAEDFPEVTDGRMMLRVQLIPSTTIPDVDYVKDARVRGFIEGDMDREVKRRVGRELASRVAEVLAPYLEGQRDVPRIGPEFWSETHLRVGFEECPDRSAVRSDAPDE